MEDTSPFPDVTFEEVADDPESQSDDEQSQSEEDDIDEQAVRDEEEETSTSEEETDEQKETPEDQEEGQTEDETDQDQDAEEEETEEEEEGEVKVIEALQSQTGIETDKEYDDTLEGVAEFINDATEERANQQINQVFEQLPEDVQTYMNFRANGGQPEEFMQTFNSNWQETELSEDDTQQHEQIVRNRLREEGWDDDDIEEAVEDYKSSGVLYNEAKRSLNRLQEIEEQRQEQLVEQQEQQAQKQQEQIEEVWNEIETTLEERSELNGIPVPEARKGDFFEWMSEPVEEGPQGQPVSRRDKAAQEADVETLLTLDYVLYLMNDEDLSFSDIIDRKAKNEKAKDLESLLDKSSGGKTPSNKDQGPSGGGSSGDEVDAGSLPDVEELIS